jgi:glycosyltransferase involved in cell wall biosynthesis
MTGRRVLVTTLPPYAGGVPAKTKMLIDVLRARGHQVSVAYYATLSDEPELDAPSWRILSGARPQAAPRTCFGDVPGEAIGCWLPELEFTYYWPSRRWQQAIGRHDRHIATGGTVLASYPLLAAGVPHLVWCASTMIEDRQDRRAAMPLPRRTFDRLVVGPVQAAMERRVLRGPGRLMVTSGHTRRLFAAMGRAARDMDALPVPVDPERFHPPATPARPGTIGFAGRITDPRKNIPLLLDALQIVLPTHPDLRLRLTGAPDDALRDAVRRRGLSGAVEFAGMLAAADLPAFYQSLDVFVIPSRQEGFGIVGVEALACGVPVVSTRCGGPEDFVRDGATGFLTGHAAHELATRIVEIVRDRALRDRLSAGARALALAEFSPARLVQTLETASQRVWGEPL